MAFRLVKSPALDADHGLSSAELFSKYAVTTCTQCTAWIASERSYGRAPSENDPTLCECCEYENKPPVG